MVKKVVVLVLLVSVIGAAAYLAYRSRTAPAHSAGGASTPQPAKALEASPDSAAREDAQPSPASGPARPPDQELEQARSAVVAAIAGVPAGSAIPQDRAPEVLAGALDRLAAVLPQLSRTSFDVEAVKASIGSDPQALFEFVRDRTSWVPYRGALRGATGVLMDRMGNSLDRALLLSALLSSAGRPAKLAHATLSREQAADLVKRVRPVRVDTGAPGRGSRALPDEAKAAVAKAMNVDVVAMKAALDRWEDLAARRLASARASVRDQSSGLIAAVGTPAATSDDTVAMAVDHWWVVTEKDGQPMALDPTLPDAEPGVAVAAAREIVDPLRLAEAHWHTVRLTVVTEHTVGGKPREQNVLSRTLRPADLIGKTIALTHQPMTWKPGPDAVHQPDARASATQALRQERQWRPRLLVGDKSFDGSTVQTEPGPATSKDPRGIADAGSAGLWGGLGGEEAPTRGGQLTAEWIDFEIRVPGRAPAKIRRAVFDLLGPAARQRQSGAGHEVTDAVRLLRALDLTGETIILPLVCRVSPEYVTWLRARAVLANRDLLLALARNVDVPPAELERLVSTSQRLPGELYDLALARHAWNDGSAEVFVGEPNILALHHTYRADASGSVAAVDGFDIVANAVAVHATAGVPAFEARVRQGVADSFAEDYVMNASRGERAVVREAESSPAGAGVITVRTPDQVAGAPVSDDVKASIALHLRERAIAVVPQGQPQAAAGWWRIDPLSGTTLRVGDLGWGQVLTETNVMHARQGLQVLSWLVCSARTLFGPERFELKEMLIFAVCQVGSGFGLAAITPSKLVITTLFAVIKDVTTIVVGNTILILM